MSTTNNSSTIDRLVVETANYLGETSDVDRRDVVKQATANGYTDQEAETIVPDVDTLDVPERDGLFGGWGHDSPGLGELESADGGLPGSNSPSESLTQFIQWLDKNEDKSHSYKLDHARKRYAQAKSVDRYFSRTYDNYSTILITRTCDEAEGPLAQQAAANNPRPVVRCRRNILKDLDVWESCAGVTLLSPRLPGADSPRMHLHTFIWIPGTDVSPEDFAPLLARHVEHVPGATQLQHPLFRAVTVEHWGPDYRGLTPQGPKDVRRGATSSLPAEVAANLPMMGVSFDARGAPEYVQQWCAAMRLGEDVDTSTKGVQRWDPLKRPSRFKELADDGKTYDRLRAAHVDAEAVGQPLGLPGSKTPNPAHDQGWTR